MAQDLTYRDAVAVTPHDTNALAQGKCRGLYIGGAGAITLRTDDDAADVVFSAVPAGTTLRISAKYVRATGTAATNIVALY